MLFRSLKQFYAARRKLTGEFPDGKVDMKKLTEEYDELEQAHNTTYGEFKTVRDDLHRLWKVKSCVDTAARFNERTEEQMLQNRPQTRHKKEELTYYVAECMEFPNLGEYHDNLSLKEAIRI